jgi:hypothetical protein
MAVLGEMSHHRWPWGWSSPIGFEAQAELLFRQ